MAEPIRILELIVSTDLGGGPAHVRELAGHLPHGEFAVTVAGPGGGPYERMFGKFGAPFVAIPTHRLGIGPLGATLRLIRKGGFDLVHSHGKGAGLYGRLAARRARVPAIHTFHGIHYSGYPAGLGRVYLALERRLGRMTDTVVCVSESEARDAEALGLVPRGRTRVIVNGIDAHRITQAAASRPSARKTLGLEPDALALGTVARFDQVKALDVLLRGFAVLAAAQPSARLVLIGDGPEARSLRALAASLGIEARVHFAGVVADASRLLPALDLYVSASRREGLPLALLEAMALGLPVAATRVSGHVDAVEDGMTGVLVGPDDPQGLGSAMESLLVNPALRATMGQAALRRVEERFSASRMAAETADLYRGAVRRFAGGRASTPGV